MTGSPRSLGLALALSALIAPSLAHAAPWTPAPICQGDAEALFNEGVELMKRGDQPGALAKFQQVLAANPSHEQAYELWKKVDHQVWLDMLTAQGEMELVAKRLMDLARMGRTERKNDGEAIKKQLDDLRASDARVSRKARNTLASEHGEYAVPYMLPTLEDAGSDDRRVMYMQTLTEMDRDVVIPLIEALNSPSPLLRRNVALVLGYIGDPRAAGMLAHVARSDDDGGARSAAEAAMVKCHASGDALSEFLKQGEAYALRHDSVLAAHQYSDVVWSWTDKGLASMPVAREIYPDEMSKKNYGRALAVDPSSLAARAGLARAFAAESAKLAGMRDAGADLGAMEQLASTDAMGLGLIGPDALDAALQNAVANNDATAGRGLIQALGAHANPPTAGLMAALGSRDGAMRSEAAIALGRHSARTRTPASSQVVTTLGEAAGREVVRTAFVIEPNAEVRGAVQAQVEQQGFASMGSERGANGLALLDRVPGVDVVIVSETLPDLTTFQIIHHLRGEPRFAKTPIYVLSANVEQAKTLFGDQVNGVIAAGEDLAPIGAAVGALTGDRAAADRLAGEAAEVLGEIAAAGGDVSSTAPALVSTLAGRDDAVTTRSMATLGRIGDSSHVGALAAVIGDAKRSEAARTVAGNALASIFSRGASATPEELVTLAGVLKSDAPAAVKNAAARALGEARLSADERANLLHTLRHQPAQG